MNERREQWINRIAAHLKQRQQRLVTAESCTGGLLAATLTAHAGASDWFEGAFITYRVSAKTHFLGVDAALVAEQHPVSEAVANAMASHALTHAGTDVAVSLTGLAGPDGDGTPVAVGTLWIGWQGPALQRAGAERFVVQAERNTFRERAVDLALHGLAQRLLPDPAGVPAPAPFP